MMHHNRKGTFYGEEAYLETQVHVLLTHCFLNPFGGLYWHDPRPIDSHSKDSNASIFG